MSDSEYLLNKTDIKGKPIRIILFSTFQRKRPERLEI